MVIQIIIVRNISVDWLESKPRSPPAAENQKLLPLFMQTWIDTLMRARWVIHQPNDGFQTQVMNIKRIYIYIAVEKKISTTAVRNTNVFLYFFFKLRRLYHIVSLLFKSQNISLWNKVSNKLQRKELSKGNRIKKM